VIDKFVRDVIIHCGDDVITMNMVEDHVIIRIVDPCSSLENVSSHVTHTFTADFGTVSVSQLRVFRGLAVDNFKIFFRSGTVGPGTDVVPLLIDLVVLAGATSSKSLRLRRLKSDRDEICQ